jgi:protein tyrosine phosphatase (PTP) superfamily phosphohydrolase (DUF442 family)
LHREFATKYGVEGLKQDYLQMRVLELAPQVYATGQLFETDLQLLSKQGVRSIVNTRPDNELEGQPSSAELAKAAEECDELQRPLIVCGRSGGQSTKIWETAESL